MLTTKQTSVTGTKVVTDPLSQFFSVSGTGNPTYLVVDALDRNEYTVSASGATGHFSGDGATLGLGSIGGDGRGAGIVFTWQASTDQYVNATYGSFNQLDFTSSASPGDVTNISVFTTSNAALATNDASDAYALMQADAAGYIGSITFADVTAPSGAGQATPDSVAATAMTFVGQPWNDNGCWVLASTIAAEAGASLPVQSTAIGVAGKSNGEWTVIYDGPAGTSAAWQNLVSTGDIIAFETGSGGGHITTCVSGSGATAMLVDNITYVNGSDQIANSANDGSANDVVVASPHPASQEWANAPANMVVIYALDTPVIAARVTNPGLAADGTLSLASLFSATDPAHRAVTQYQVYDSAASDTILVGGKPVAAHSASTAATASALSQLVLKGGTTATTDTLEIRAYNGLYWGDWQTLTVSVAAPLAPVLAARTPNQTWHQGQAVNFAVSAAAFKDPQGLALSYSASGVGGALPSWLHFNAATQSFTGTVPAGMENFSVNVTATDDLGLSASETFSVAVPAAAPVLRTPAPAQSWVTNGAVDFRLPTTSFSDPQGEALTLKASLSSGAALPSWLSFNASTLTFSGTAPATAATMSIKVTATGTSGLSASELFAASIVKGATAEISLADWQMGVTASPLPVAAVPPLLAHANVVDTEPSAHLLLAMHALHHV
ncbi:MAG TPA: putative Ig domain-containing protein [Acetobacteraceae bacterium]|nr:putative Ig domain-containing protein [Acetobacteraceae bacterium]